MLILPPVTKTTLFLLRSFLARVRDSKRLGLPHEWNSRMGIFAGKLINTIPNALRADIPLATTAKYSCVSFSDSLDRG